MISTYRRQAVLVSSSPVGSYSPSERASAPANRICDKTRQARPWRRHRTAAGRPAARRWTRRDHPRPGPRPHRRHLRRTHRRRHRPRRVVSPRGQRQAQRRHARPRADLARPHRQSWRVPAQPVTTAVLVTPEAPTKAGGSAAVSIDQTPRPVVLTEASRARIAAAQEEIRRVLTDSAQRTRSGHTNRTPSARSATPRWQAVGGTTRAARGVHRWPPGRPRA